MKKFFAILISVALLVGLMAGCGTQTNEPAPTGGAATPVAAGMLVLNVGASINISYDADGLVLDVEGADDNGSVVAGEYTDYLGKSVSEAVCDLITCSNMSTFLGADTGYVLIKQAFGSALPGSSFLDTIKADAEAAVKEYSPAQVILFTEENLDENGYIDLESAKVLLLAYLGLDTFDTLEGSPEPVNGLYGFALTAGTLQDRYIIDAVTGLVCEGELDDVNYGDEDLENETDIVEPTDEIIVEDTTAATDPLPTATEPAEEDPV